VGNFGCYVTKTWCFISATRCC